MSKKNWWLVFIALGLLISIPAAALGEDQEVRSVQKAIASEKLSWQAGETSMTRLSGPERRMRLGGRLADKLPRWEGERVAIGQALPLVLDWRNNNGNWISSVKDQGNCGSCWAFATTALLESMVKISKRLSQDVDLSEQMLLSCSKAGNCVAGGYEYKAAEYIRRTGIPNEACYPYTANDSACNPCAGWGGRVVKIASWNWVAASTSAIEAALQSGPVTSWMMVYQDLFHYKSGIYKPTAGSPSEGGHFIVIVGYNHTEKYWICKNSWGRNWGESGFFRVTVGQSGLGGQVLRMVRPILDNQPPVLQPIPDQSADEGGLIAFNLSASDADGDPLQFRGINLPSGASVDATSGAFTWTPSYTQSGTYQIQLAAADGITEDVKTVNITVRNVKRKQW